jgi:hypothetical protein
MLHGGAASLAVLKYGAASGLNDILCHGVDDRFARQVDALDFVTMVLWGWIESDDEVQTRVESFAMQREAAAQGILFKHLLVFRNFVGDSVLYAFLD